MWSLHNQLDLLDDEMDKNPTHLLTTLSEKYGFDYFALLSDTSHNPNFKNAISHCNWPPGFLHYLGNLKISHIPELLDAMLENFCPFFWEPSYDHSHLPDDDLKHMLDMIEDSNLLSGLIVPVFGPFGNQNAAVFGGLRKPLSNQDIAILQYHTFKIFDQISMENGAIKTTIAEKAKIGLSIQEKKCLFWSAQGKASHEIGEIMGFSELTINQFLKSAMTTLNATTLAQAIVLAMKHRVL